MYKNTYIPYGYTFNCSISSDGQKALVQYRNTVVFQLINNQWVAYQEFNPSGTANADTFGSLSDNGFVATSMYQQTSDHINRWECDISSSTAVTTYNVTQTSLQTNTNVFPKITFTNPNTSFYIGGDASFNSNVEILGDLIVKNDVNIIGSYKSENIEYITTTNYEVIVSEDISLNGGLSVSGEAIFNSNVGIGTTTPQVPLHVSSPSESVNCYFETTGGYGQGENVNLIFKNQHYQMSGITGIDEATATNGGFEAGLAFKTTYGTGATSMKEQMRITAQGKVGIGTNTPEASLHVATGNLMSTLQDTTGLYLDNWDTTVRHGFNFNNQHWISIYADYSIFSETYIVASDRRMKTNIVDVPDNLALQQVRDIPCRYYEYIDKIKKGTKKVVGFIAQEVKEVLPGAITLVNRYIPDEYRKLENISWELSNINGNNSYNLTTDLSGVSGIKYKFIVSNDMGVNPIEKEIIGNNDNTFTFDKTYDFVFCYGKQVNDFQSIDKNQIFALHHSAIQEIDKLQLEEKDKVTALETKVTALETKNAELQTQIDNIMTILNNNNLS